MPLRIVVDGTVRTANVVIPVDWYDHDLPLPVVVLAHGSGESAAMMADRTRFHDVMYDSYDDRFVCIYLEAIAAESTAAGEFTEIAPDLRDNEQRKGGHFDLSRPNASLTPPTTILGQDERTYVEAVIDLVDERLTATLLAEFGQAGPALDRERVYGVGFSNGGMLIYQLATLGLFTSICVCSGTTGSKPTPSLPWSFSLPTPTSPRIPVLHLHGLDDPKVRPFLDYFPPGAGASAAELERLEDMGLTASQIADLETLHAPIWVSILAWRWHDGIGAAAVMPSGVAVFIPSFGGPPSNPALYTIPGLASPFVNVAAAGSLVVAGCLYTDVAHEWPQYGLVDAARMIWSFFKDPMPFV